MSILDSLTAIVRYVMRDVWLLGRYPCTVQSQHDDDTVDVLPDAARYRGKGLSRVPIRHGLPGVRVRVSSGARVLLGYEGGDPRRPYVALWDPGSVEQILFNGGGSGVARLGDIVTFTLPPFDVAGDLDGAKFTARMIPVSPTSGTIDSASTKVEIG
jgi:hypothetical protein